MTSKEKALSIGFAVAGIVRVASGGATSPSATPHGKHLHKSSIAGPIGSASGVIRFNKAFHPFPR